MKLPYERIILEADRLFMKSAQANSLSESLYYFIIYSYYLEACGWTEQEFDAETIKRIDNNWDSPWLN